MPEIVIGAPAVRTILPYQFLNTEADDYFDAAGLIGTDERRIVVDQLFNELKLGPLSGENILAQMDVLQMPWLNTYVNAAEPGVADGELINGGTGLPVHTTDRGVTTNGVDNYYNTHFNPTTHPTPQFGQNNNLGAIWVIDDGTWGSGVEPFGWFDETDGYTLNPRRASLNRHEVRAGQATLGTSGNNTVNDARGFHLINRTASNGYTVRHNNVQTITAGTVSTAPNNHDLYVGNGRAGAFQAIHFGVVIFGKSISPNARADLYNSLRTVATYLGIP